MFQRIAADGRRENFYRLLARCLGSGLALPRALRASSRGEPFVQHIVQRIEHGETLAGALKLWPGMPRVEHLVIDAAERSGQLPQAFEAMAADLGLQREQRREILRQSAYPVLVLHLIPPATSTGLLIQRPGSFFLWVLLCYVIFWSVIAGLALLHRRLRSHDSYALNLRRLPLLGRLLRRLDQQGLCRVLVWLYSAGIPFASALRQAVESLPYAPSDWQRAADLAGSGTTMAEVFEGMTSLEPLLRSELVTASEIGDLEASLGTAVARIQRDVASDFAQLARRIGGLIYLLAVASVAASALRFYTRYLGALQHP